jgi:DNA mismatch repair protein MutL
MSDIKKLPEDVANQISAGEVIERPASVVKELVENSIDAGSDQIHIEIENGGKNRIRVRDNGSGIKGNELKLAFSRYATSKIEKINDLYSLKTLGFRGEALASIASVSRVEVRTRANDELKGSFLKIEGGRILNLEQTGAPQGTDIIVDDLFFNTPARYKYLKTTNTETGHISNVIIREALAYPEIQFKLEHNNHVVLQTPGNGKMIDAIYAIYGEELVNSLLAIDYEDRYIKINGYIANPVYYRSTRYYQIFFVNRRAVNNLILNRGVEAGYQGLLPPGSYPVVFLNLKLNQIMVDINIHPTKREIKFSRDEIIKDVITKGIKTILEKSNNTPRFQIKTKQQVVKEKESNELPFKDRIKTRNDTGYTVERKDEYKSNKENNNENEIININENRRRIIGQVYNTYIIVESEDGLYIIDQHNAHERVLYDRIYKKYQDGNTASQPLLLPVTIEINLPEMEIYNKYREDLFRLGLKIETFGQKSLIVQEVPNIIKEVFNKKVIRELIDNLREEGKTTNRADLIEQIIRYMSCRGAIKAGKEMKEREMERLVNDLFHSTNYNRCPHGRPITIYLSKNEIEKNIGRS